MQTKSYVVKLSYVYLLKIHNCCVRIKIKEGRRRERKRSINSIKKVSYSSFKNEIEVYFNKNKKKKKGIN